MRISHTPLPRCRAAIPRCNTPTSTHERSFDCLLCTSTPYPLSLLPVQHILLLPPHSSSARASLDLTGTSVCEGGGCGGDFLPIGRRVFSSIRIVLLGRSTHAGDARPNESIIRSTHQHHFALYSTQYPPFGSRLSRRLTHQPAYEICPNHSTTSNEEIYDPVKICLSSHSC